MNAALNGTRRALRLGTGLATCVSCIVFAQQAFGQAVTLPNVANANGATVSTSMTTPVMTVDANGASRAIDWNTFSVGATGVVNFVSPGTATALTVVNRVIGTSNGVGVPRTITPSVIDGKITSTPNIAVWLVNPSGITFGAAGSFNGASLVLSTLDIPSLNPSSAILDPNGDQVTRLTNRDVAANPASVKIDLKAGTGALVSSGSVLLLGENITVDKSIRATGATGDVFIVAASDALITTQAGSPIKYQFLKGTRFEGVEVVGTGSVQGRSIVVAASNGSAQLKTLLQVESGAQLSASKTGDGIQLLTTSNPVTVGASANANIVSTGQLRTTGTDSDVKITSNASATVNRIVSSGDVTVRSGTGATHTLNVGAVQAADTIDLRSTGAMRLGTGGNQNIFAGGSIAINSGATINRGGAVGDTLAIGSFRDATALNSALTIRSVGDMNLGNASLAAGPLGTAALSLTSTAGSVTFGSAVANRFTASAFNNVTASGAITVNAQAVVTPGNALSISAGNSTAPNTTPGNITLASVRTTGADQDISIRSNGTSGDIVATSISASRNLTISSTTAASTGSGSSAASIRLGNATAGQSIALRSTGAVIVTGGLTAGNTQPLGNVVVSGLPGGAAASFSAATVNAKTGLVNVQATTQTIGQLISAQAATLTSTGTGVITLGSANVGTNLTVTADDDIVLGTAATQTIGAKNRVTITSKLGAIRRGAGSAALTVVSGNDDPSGTDPLTIKAREAVNLGNAALLGGRALTAPVSVQSENASIVLGSVRASRFTGQAGTTFAATGAISATSMSAATGNTIAITGRNGITLASATTGGTGENIVLNTVNGAVTADSIVARNNLTIGSGTSPASTIAANTLRAINGSLNAFAQSMRLGTVRAGTSLGLRAERNILITGLVRAETNLTVAGITSPGGPDLFDAVSVTAATGSVDIKADGTDIDTLVSGTNTTIAGVTAQLGSATVGKTAVAGGPLGNLTIRTTDNTTLGKLANQTVSAKGAITISGANIRQGAAATGLVITANTDGVGANALTLNATNAIQLSEATLNGGLATGTAAQKSAVRLTSGTATAIDKVNAAALNANAGTTFRADGAIVTADNASIKAGGVVTLNNVTAGGTGRDITITTPGAITAAALKASGDVTVGGGATSFRATTVEATTGAIDIKAGATNIDTATAGTNIGVTGATATLGTVTAGKTPVAGNLTVKTTGDITLGKLANQRQSATGAVTVESTSGSIRQGAAGLTLTANSDGTGTEALTLKAGSAIALGTATLNGGRAQQSAINLTSGAATTIDKANAAAFTATSGGAFGANGAILAKDTAAIKATGPVNLTTVTVSGADRDIAITTPGAITATGLKAGRNVTIGGVATAFRANTVEATNGSVTVAAGATDIGSVVSGLNTRVTGTTAVLGTVTAGKANTVGNLTVITTGDTTLGKLANQRQSATGAISIKSNGGSIRQGQTATGLILTANSNGAGAEALALEAGSAIALGDATLNGGLANGTSAQKSTIRLTSGAATTIGKANAGAFAANSRGIFTAKGPVIAAENASIIGGSSVIVNTVTTTGANRDITITTPGAITAGTLKATRNVTIAGGTTASFNATNVEATTGSIDVKARATDIAAAVSGLNTRIAGTTAELGSVTAGKTSPTGGLTVQTTNDITLGKLANQTQTAAGAVLIESTGGSIRQGATGLRITSNSNGRDAEALTLKATKGVIALDNATLSGGPARQSNVTLTSGGNMAIANASGARVTATSTNGSITASGAIAATTFVSLKSDADTTIGSASGSNVTAIAGEDFTVTRSIKATNNVVLTSTGKITTGGPVAAGNSVKLSASDATIGATVSAKTIDVTNTGRTGLVIGGTAESATNKFALSSLEAARLRTTETLTLGADGSDDVELKQVDFTAPKTVRVLANGKRIDVTGRVSFDSGTTLKLGGDVATGAGNASIIQVASESGGRIAGADGRLELGAVNIVVGNNALIKSIADAAGLEAKVAVATSLNRAAGSVLYNGGEGQAILVRAGSMKINFNGLALFQNTGTSLLGQGVSLGAPGAAAVALDLVSNRPTPVFALFGSINGVVNNATALLGNPPLARYEQIALSRLNGCVIGGGNCLSVQNLTPSLTAVDNIRSSIFTVKPDFQVPFDPLVGTNNDALFDDVGSTGLGALPMTPIECSDPSGTCSTQKKDGK